MEVKNNILARKRKIGNERLSKTKQTDHHLFLHEFQTVQMRSWMMTMKTRTFNQ